MERELELREMHLCCLSFPGGELSLIVYNTKY